MLKIKVDSQIKLTSEEIASKAAAKGQSAWIKDPGVQDLTIDEVINTKKDGSPYTSKDPNWARVRIVFSNSKGQKLTDWYDIPLNGKNEFGFIRDGKEPDYRPFQRFCNLMSGIGALVEDYTKILGVVDHYFGANLKTNLIGRKLKGDIQYKGLNIRYMGKDEEGKTLYQLFNWENPHQVREGEEAEIVAGYDACKNYVLGLGIKEDQLNGFPSLKTCLPSEAQVAVEVVDEADEALPF